MLSTPTATTRPIVQRQFSQSPMSIPTGTPATVPVDSPKVTIAIARPRSLSATMAAAVAVATAVSTPAPAPATTREPRKTSMPGDTTVMRLPRLNTPSAISSARAVLPRVSRPDMIGPASA